MRRELAAGGYAAAIVEGIQGVAGIRELSAEFLRALREETSRYGVVLILDEIQSGYGRTGRFFAHQHAGIRADIVTTAKGMGNGFPIGGTLISPAFRPAAGMIGTTFGGNHLSCAAALAVLEIMEREALVDAAADKGGYIISRLRELQAQYPHAIKEIRGRGLMVGIETSPPFAAIRDRLLFEDHIFTGGAAGNVIRLLPPLTVTLHELDLFLEKLEKQIDILQKEINHTL